MAETGKLLNPEVHWYKDESCLEKCYDLVMISGSLQYMEDWEEALRRICRVAKEYFFLARIPVVEKGASFVMIERYYTEMTNLNQVLNQDALLQVVESTGLRLIREFVAYPPKVRNAPEVVELRSWLFKRDST